MRYVAVKVCQNGSNTNSGIRILLLVILFIVVVLNELSNHLQPAIIVTTPRLKFDLIDNIVFTSINPSIFPSVLYYFSY
jgi:hypothetical protein